MMYGSQVWGQIQNKYVNRIIKLQDRAIRVINFASYFASRNQLYKKSRILKLSDNIQLSNDLLVHASYNHALPMAFKDTFKPIKEKQVFYSGCNKSTCCFAKCKNTDIWYKKCCLPIISNVE